MADDDPISGLGELRDRLARRSRQVPPPRRAAPTSEVTALSESKVDAKVGEGSPADEPVAAPMASAPRARRAPAPMPAPTGHPHTSPDEPSANLAIRVRRSLDEHLAELIFELRREGIRTSKVELIEMLLWELPPRPSSALTARLGAFRHGAPRRDQL